MNLQSWGCARFLVVIAWIGVSGIGHAADGDAVAEIRYSTGPGTVTDNDGGAVRSVTKGDKVFSGDVVSTGPATYINLKFIDGSFVLLRPKSRFMIEDFQLKGATPSASKPKAALPLPSDQTAAPAATPSPVAAEGSRAFFRLLKGGFRAVSGAIGKLNRNEYRVSTAVATIGIRGTDYSASVCDAACAADPVVRAEIAEGYVAEGGLVTDVESGGVDVDSEGKNCDSKDQTGTICPVNKDQSLLVTQDGSQFRLGEVPKFLADDPIPDPRVCGS